MFGQDSYLKTSSRLNDLRIYSFNFQRSDTSRCELCTFNFKINRLFSNAISLRVRYSEE